MTLRLDNTWWSLQPLVGENEGLDSELSGNPFSLILETPLDPDMLKGRLFCHVYGTRISSELLLQTNTLKR